MSAHAYALEQMMQNPDIALDDLDRYESERSLINFIKCAWPVLEPSRKFVTGWHIEAVCEHLEAVTYGDITRLLINVPPGFMKSLTTDVFWPAWEWGPKDMPSMRYVSASYSEALTIRDNRRCRNVIQCDKYQRIWGSRFSLLDEQNAKIRFDTNKTGFKIATSVEGLGTGERGDRFIIDDPHNVKDGESEAKRLAAILWFTETVPTRINDPSKSAIIVIMQRVHDKDVSGKIIADELGYDHLCLPMEFEPHRRCYVRVPLNYMGVDPEPVRVVKVKIDTDTVWMPEQDCANQDIEIPDNAQVENRFVADIRDKEGELLWKEQYPAEVVERDKKVLGTYASAGQFQQRPTPRKGGLFKRADFEIVDAAPAAGNWLRGWDLAASTRSTSPYTASVKMKIVKGIVYIGAVDRFRVDESKLESSVVNIAKQDGRKTKISIPQDPGQAGKVQKASFAKALAGYDVSFSPESGDKELRATPFAAQVEAGNVKLVRGPWNDEYLDEASLFPRGFKDQIDATSRAYGELIKPRIRKVGASPQIVTN